MPTVLYKGDFVPVSDIPDEALVALHERYREEWEKKCARCEVDGPRSGSMSGPEYDDFASDVVAVQALTDQLRVIYAVLFSRGIE